MRRDLALSLPYPDPFKEYWKGEFEAKMISTSGSSKLEIVEAGWIIAHVARWQLSPSEAVVLNLNKVRNDNL